MIDAVESLYQAIGGTLPLHKQAKIQTRPPRTSREDRDRIRRM